MEEKIEMLDALFRHATEGILIVSPEGVIVMINPKGEELFGYTKEELIGKKIETLVPMRYASVHTHHRSEYTSQPHARAMGLGIDLYARRKDDSEFPVEVSLSPFSAGGKRFIMSFIVDITERKRHELQMLAMNAELEDRVEARTEELADAITRLAESKQEVMRALESEKELNELKSRFISTASHEFRTPLATILSSASLISQYNHADDLHKREKHLERIRSAVRNLNHILNDFLSLSKLEEGAIRNTPSEISISSFVGEILEEINTTLKPGQEIDWVDETGASHVNLDPQLLKNVLLNLLSNASKYSPPYQAITFNTARNEGALVLTITDHGIGIPSEDQEKLFERFFRAKNAQAVQGTGLGLNIVKRYLELMGGDISFSSRENSGSTFIVEVPL